MINEALLKQILVEQKELVKQREDYIERESLKEVRKFIKLKHIIVITGHRRAGKSVFLSQIINNFYGGDNVYYLNLDDERLIGLHTDDLNTVMELFHQLFGAKKVIFLDEIQNLEGWERFVSRLLNQGYKIYITGSNANLLSSELASFLTGRYLEIKIFPFSFREFLHFKNIPIEKIEREKSYYITEIKATIKNLLNEYLKWGGFPEMVKYNEPAILRTLFFDVITKDVVNRYNINEPKTLKEIAHYLLSNIANEFSYNRIKNTYSIGSVHTVKTYLDYLTSTYMVFEVPKFSHAVREIHTRSKKIYAIDNGFFSSAGFTTTHNSGRLLENLVFIELKRRGKEVYYYKDARNREVDFVIKENNRITEAIQVCYNISNEKVRKREISSLLAGMKNLGLKKGLILTMDTEEKISVEGYQVEFYPVWRWLLGW